MTEKCYAIDGEFFKYDDIAEALSDMACNGDLIVGAEYESGDSVKSPASSYFDVERLLEDMGERAYDECGEYAEDFPNISKEKVAELDKLIRGWLDENVTVDFYTVKNTQKHLVTEDDVREYGDSAA